jgi:ectoine hydroxylase-related dioxygenase (phytanoyl-CoA dioxygenase family)
MLTDEQKAHFYALGFVKVPGMLTSEEVDEFSWRFDAIIEKGETQGDDSEAAARIFPYGHRVIIPLIEADRYFYNLLDHPNLASIAEDLLGDDCIFFGCSDGQIHSGNTNWHRDGGSPDPAIEAKLTFYLDDVAPGKGCLSFIPGSHLWPLHFNDLAKQIDEHVLGYPMREFPGRYDLPAEKGDVIVFQTRIWHSSWGGGANRRQMAWMMRTAPRMQWEIDRIVEFNKRFAQMWSQKTGRLVSDRLFETADPRRMKKIQLLKDLGV